jgi:membrane associated rhomboid family serine protease
MVACMARIGSTTISLPAFTGATKRLVIANLVGFLLVVLGQYSIPLARATTWLVLVPAGLVHHGAIWTLVTYSFLDGNVLATLFNMLVLWFIGSYLETAKGSRWLYEAYFLCIIGGAVIGSALSFTGIFHLSPNEPVAGPSGAIFGLLVAFAVFFGEQQFLLFFLVSVKAKYLVVIYLLIGIARLIMGINPVNQLVYLGGALLGFLFARSAPGRGMTFSLAERYYGMRNDYYRWKRRRAARKFEVYMGKHGRAVHFDKEGRFIDPDTTPDPLKGPRDPRSRRWARRGWKGADAALRSHVSLNLRLVERKAPIKVATALV